MSALTPSNNNLYTGIVAFLLFFLAVQFSQQHVEHSYEVIQSLVPLLVVFAAFANVRGQLLQTCNKGPAALHLLAKDEQAALADQ